MAKRSSNLYKRKDGRWEGRYIKSRKIDGTAVYGSVYGHSYGEVKEKLLQATLKMDSKQAQMSENQTFEETMMQWLQHNSVRIKGGTRTKYQSMIRTHLAPDIGKISVRDIDSSLIDEYLLQKLKDGRLDGKGGLSPSYVQTLMLIINSTLKYAVTEGLRLPLKTQICRPSIPKHELQIMSIEDQKKLESCIISKPNLTKIGIMISMCTGLRIGEICGLRRSDLDMDKRIIKVRHTIARVMRDDNRSTCLILDSPKTKASLRDIPISDKLYSFLVSVRWMLRSEFIISNNNSYVNPRTFEYRFHATLNRNFPKNRYYHPPTHAGNSDISSSQARSFKRDLAFFVVSANCQRPFILMTRMSFR